MIVAFLVVVIAGLWVVARRRRATRLSGTSSAAPVFHVEPPRRRVSGLGSERL